MNKNNTHSLILTAFLSVISLILSLVKILIPFIAPFLSLDLAFIPLFFALILLNYKSAITVSLIKNVLHFLLISHEPIGSIANLIVEIVFLSCIFYFYKKDTKKFILGGIFATFVITVIMSIINYFILLPLYGYITDLGDILNNLKLLIVKSIIPFNIIKGFFLIFLFFFTKNIIKRLPKQLTNKFKT